MRHQRSCTRLGRRKDHRISMLRNLTTSLLRHKRITTTQVRAKEVQKLAEHIITLAKRGDLAAQRRIFRYISDKEVAKDLFEVIAPMYKEASNRDERKGGYTRIIKIGPRKGDAAPMVFLELV